MMMQASPTDNVNSMFSPEKATTTPADMGEEPPKAQWSMFSPPHANFLTTGVAASLTPQGAPSDPPPRRTKKASALRPKLASKENSDANTIDNMLSPWKAVEDVEEEEELVLESNSSFNLMEPSPLLAFLKSQPAWLQAFAKALLCLNDQMLPPPRQVA